MQAEPMVSEYCREVGMPIELHEIQTEWHAMRGLSLDLLDACTQSDLSAALPDCGPVWKQFRHIGGVHEDYLDAIRKGRVSFDGECRSYQGDGSREQLLQYFGRLSQQHEAVLSGASEVREVEWFGERVSLGTHLLRLIAHETLHHGQFILLWRTRGMPMPASWQAWGV